MLHFQQHVFADQPLAGGSDSSKQGMLRQCLLENEMLFEGCGGMFDGLGTLHANASKPTFGVRLQAVHFTLPVVRDHSLVAWLSTACYNARN